MVNKANKRISTKRYARGLKRRQTDAERALWGLRLLSYKPQVAVYGYVPDFYSKLFGVTVEVQGSVHKLKGIKKRDKAKRRNMRARGIYTMYVSNRYAVQAPLVVAGEAFLTGIIWRLYTMVRV